MISKVPVENVFPADESCPDCGGFVWRPGPRGGAAQNIECVGCGARFNITRWDRNYDRAAGLPDRPGPMPIVWAQRIPSEKDGGGAWREDMFPKVLE
jgi:hypothetical protein